MGRRMKSLGFLKEQAFIADERWLTYETTLKPGEEPLLQKPKD